MIEINGVKVPKFNVLVNQIIDQIPDPVGRMNACEHAWEIYMDLGDLFPSDAMKRDSLYRESQMAMGAMWAFRGCLK